MPSVSSDLPQTLIIQLARLGDLLQSLPVLSSLREKFSNQSFDLLCSQPLVDLGKLFPGIHQTIPWNGEDLHVLAKGWDRNLSQGLSQSEEYFSRFPAIRYSIAYNLNNHPRSILASHLLGAQVIGAGEKGPLNPSLPPWVEYLRQVAGERGENRIHLADAFCGICGVMPPSAVPVLEVKDIVLPSDIVCIGKDVSVINIGIVLGAGDADRRVPVSVWQEFIQLCIEQLPNCRVVLIGGSGERESSLVLEQNLPDHMRNQLINCCGQTTLPQLVSLFNHCQWVVGSDTGPLHLGVMCGAQAIGWYFSRARVHETGPYGEGHWVWQAERYPGRSGMTQEDNSGVSPTRWPVKGSVDLMVNGHCQISCEGWSLWNSHRDYLGVFYSEKNSPAISSESREHVWRQLVDETTRDWNSTMKVFGISRSQMSTQV